MEKLLYFVGGIIVGSIGTLAALGFTEEELDGVGNEYYRQGNEEELGFSNEENFGAVLGCVCKPSSRKGGSQVR